MAAKKKAAHAPKRTRTNVIFLRLSDREREMVDRLAEREGMASVSEWMRWTIRREHDAATRKGAK